MTLMPRTLFLAFALVPACMRQPEATTPPTNPPTNAQPAPAVKTPTPEAPKAAPTPAPEAPKAAPTPTPEAPKAAPSPAAGLVSSLNAPGIGDLGKVIDTIKDAPTAEAAKGKLDAIVQKLESAKAALGGKDAGGVLGQLAGSAASKLGVSPETVKQVGALLDNPSIKAVIGPTLEKLQGLLK